MSSQLVITSSIVTSDIIDGESDIDDLTADVLFALLVPTLPATSALLTASCLKVVQTFFECGEEVSAMTNQIAVCVRVL